MIFKLINNPKPFKLAGNDEVKKRLAASGTWDVLVPLLHEAPADLAVQALTAMRKLVRDDEACRKQLVAAGACDMVVTCIRRHGAHKDITQCGLQVMTNLAHQNDEISK